MSSRCGGMSTLPQLVALVTCVVCVRVALCERYA